MKRNNISQLILIMLVAFSVFLVGCSNSSQKTSAQKGGTINLKIRDKTDKGDWGEKQYCKHFYNISVDGEEIMSKVPLEQNTTTVITLPKTNSKYAITFGKEGLDAGGRVVPYRSTCDPNIFKGNKDFVLTFSCNLRGGSHSISTVKWKESQD